VGTKTDKGKTKHGLNRRKIQGDASLPEHATASDNGLQELRMGKTSQELETKATWTAWIVETNGVVQMVQFDPLSLPSGRGLGSPCFHHCGTFSFVGGAE
jgi:hypothetical protein